ncbi:MAG: restriction endonuclease [Ignavibacteria bacterium]|nr:restriction endonuclease [Ignavibacteria bacterium]
MTYDEFSQILNKHIFENEKTALLKNIANRPERFIGLFRPTKLKTKILQFLLQSHEIRMGDAIEELIELILSELNFLLLPKNIKTNSNETLKLDQYFTDGAKYYFIEQKIRDDHDSTKKKGQIENFKQKVNALFSLHGSKLCAIMYFIDPTLKKNKNFYANELKIIENYLRISTYLFYGNELFDFINHPEIWDDLLNKFNRWKENLPDLPNINFDSSPKKSFEELKNLEPSVWKKILTNQLLWSEGVIKVIFKDGSTFKLLKSYFETFQSKTYKQLFNILSEKLNEYY